MKKLTVIITLLSIIILSGCTTSKNISISKEIPSNVTSGKEFNFTIIVNNDDTEKHELRSIDISNKFLKGIMILKTNYDIKEEYDTFWQHIFEFKKDIPIKSEIQIVFTAKAIRSGDFSGDLDICIDGDSSCLFNSIRIIVD